MGLEKRLVDQQAVGRQRLAESGEERAVQVVHDDDHRVAASEIRDARLEIEGPRLQRQAVVASGMTQGVERVRVSVDRADPEAPLGQPESVAAAAAGHVQRPALTRQQGLVRREPRRGARRSLVTATRHDEHYGPPDPRTLAAVDVPRLLRTSVRCALARNGWRKSAGREGAPGRRSRSLYDTEPTCTDRSVRAIIPLTSGVTRFGGPGNLGGHPKVPLSRANRGSWEDVVSAL